MARIRSIKPGYFTSLDIAGISIPARLHFAGLWTYADDHGRGVDDPRLIKAAVWPLDDDVTPDDIEAMQAELAAHGRIVRYVNDGRRYFEVVNWHEHQKPNRPQDSNYPDSADSGSECVVSDDALHAHEQISERSLQEGRGLGGEGRGVGGESVTSPVGDGSDQHQPPNVDVSDEARTLTREFAAAVRANGHAVPGRDTNANRSWLVEMDRLLRLGPPGEGGHVPDVDEVRQVIAYATGDEFEKANVASVPKLRKRFAQLRLKASRSNGSAPTPAEVTTTRRLQ